MKRPSKKEIRAAIEKLHEHHKEGQSGPNMNVPKPSGKKGSQGAIRKKSAG